MQHEGVTTQRTPDAGSTRAVWVLAAIAALAVLIANASGIATGDDGVGYRAIADSLLAGDGLGYFLEDPLTVWPPVWPALMALVAWLTPADTMGAAILLNAAVAAGVVVAGHRVLRTVVTDDRVVLAGTAVLALGPTTVGFGRLLMTDMAFGLLVLVWSLTLFRFRRTGALRDLLAAAALAWLGFGLRYVGLVLVGFGALWVLLDSRRTGVVRVRNAALYGLTSLAAPVAWMIRNHSIDGTFTGERHASARGLVDNAFDVAATLGRFLLPGLGYGMAKPWAVVGVIAVGVIAWAASGTFAASGVRGPRALLGVLGTPVGLLLLTGSLYLLYMLYVRTTTALNQLDVRLLFPAYFPLMAAGLALVDRMVRLGGRDGRLALRATMVWGALNVAAGLVAMVAFALGHPYFSGNYEADVFDEVRASPALDALPEDCRVYSNLPNALYPAVESLWSPMRTALESREAPDPGFGLDEITATLDDVPSCLVWIDEQPRYGHLWPLDELADRVELVELATSDNVEVFRMQPAR